MTEKFYSINEVLEMLNISRPTLYLEIKKGNLRLIKIRRRSFIKASELENWIANLPTFNGGK